MLTAQVASLKVSMYFKALQHDNTAFSFLKFLPPRDCTPTKNVPLQSPLTAETPTIPVQLQAFT